MEKLTRKTRREIARNNLLVTKVVHRPKWQPFSNRFLIQMEAPRSSIAKLVCNQLEAPQGTYKLKQKVKLSISINKTGKWLYLFFLFNENIVFDMVSFSLWFFRFLGRGRQTRVCHFWNTQNFASFKLLGCQVICFHKSLIETVKKLYFPEWVALIYLKCMPLRSNVCVCMFVYVRVCLCVIDSEKM